MKKRIITTYHDCCAHHTKLMCKLLRLDQQIYKNWLDFFVNEYTDFSLHNQDMEKIENPIIMSFIVDSVECFDGIGILHQQGSVTTAYPILRKLMELYFQIKFILQDDTENRALAFEAYYVSRKTRGKDDDRNVYLKYDKYRAYKKEADRIYNEENYHYYPEWYEIYDTVEKQPCSKSQRKKLITSLKKLCEANGDAEIYDTLYNLLSKITHGFYARDNVKLIVSARKNYLREYRDPTGISYQTSCSNLLLSDIYRVFCKHYGIQADYDFLKKHSDLVKSVRSAENNYVESLQKQDESFCSAKEML